jgi:hypothetical protein
MSSEMGDVLKLVELTQTEIDNLSDQGGLYMNSTTGNLSVDGGDIAGGGDMLESTYDPNSVQDDAFDYGNFLGTFQIKGSSTTVNLTSDVDNLDVDDYNIVNITSGSQGRRITGIKAPPAGVNRVIYFFNISSSFRSAFVHQSGSSLVNNRIVLRSSAGTRNLQPYQLGIAIYNHTINKWQITRIA